MLSLWAVGTAHGLTCRLWAWWLSLMEWRRPADSRDGSCLAGLALVRWGWLLEGGAACGSEGFHQLELKDRALSNRQGTLLAGYWCECGLAA